jgi:tripartite-type tricarboxylate transporter receptor subunit TctC
MRYTAIASSLIVLAATFVAPAVHSVYPERALRFIVSSPPGGANDILARTIGQNLAASVGQQVVVDNRAGAGGIIAAELAAKAQPDGHTLLFATDSTLTVNPQLYRNLPYDPERDFIPVTITTVVTRCCSRIHRSGSVTLKGIALAKSNPGSLNTRRSATEAHSISAPRCSNPWRHRLGASV